jgi:hypothetical protein
MEKKSFSARDAQNRLPDQRKYKRKAHTLEQIHLAQRGNAVQDLLDIRLEGADGELVLTYQVNAEKLALAERRRRLSGDGA